MTPNSPDVIDSNTMVIMQDCIEGVVDVTSRFGRGRSLHLFLIHLKHLCSRLRCDYARCLPTRCTVPSEVDRQANTIGRSIRAGCLNSARWSVTARRRVASGTLTYAAVSSERSKIALGRTTVSHSQMPN